MPAKNIPITVFTGFLGAGKTSIILSLLPRLPKDYKVVLLKNEFGDVEVDSKLARQSSLAAVSEILNGCMCCVLVGQMKTALLEIRERYRPDRIIVECSSVPPRAALEPSRYTVYYSDTTLAAPQRSAFPATLAFQIRELERETGDDLKLDAIVTVVDAENFTGYEDTSPTAKMQASYTDVILINKWEHVSERQLDILIDHLNTLNDTTPKIKCQPGARVDPALVLGLDSSLFPLGSRHAPEHEHELPDGGSSGGGFPHHDEVEAATVYTGPAPPCSYGAADHAHCAHTHAPAPPSDADSGAVRPVAEAQLLAALSALSKETVWRVKGLVRLERGLHILNWAFGRYELTPCAEAAEEQRAGSVRLTVMGERGEVQRAARRLAEKIGARVRAVS